MIYKEKITLEYTFNSSPKVLFNRLSTPSGLSEWFAKDVNVRGKIYTFFWDKSEEKAELISKKDNKFVKFRWLNEDDDEAYFELKINIEELTGDLALIITDFVDPDGKEDAVDLWDNSVANLKRVIGT
ncbi:MAG: hypothetical protein A2W91_14880 [Bacteroidetes bacterium GWF2_38_335]|nr:MAG: hypothetical protein A2W91_14880 [Bacteroidetes bacterium GWF2_38_335]OFY78484.1 MAG: hypothetical protein A2281_16190 [Bacteroidetes bacterium RIFOXYA12_FULL_38_20]HBS88433.1 hypothetical protein [Bacteroidales bacterium]